MRLPLCCEASPLSGILTRASPLSDTVLAASSQNSAVADARRGLRGLGASALILVTVNN